MSLVVLYLWRWCSVDGIMWKVDWEASSFVKFRGFLFRCRFGHTGVGVYYAAPMMRSFRCWIAWNSSRGPSDWPFIVWIKFLVAFTILSVLDIVGLGRLWWRNLKVSVIQMALALVTALMQWYWLRAGVKYHAQIAWYPKFCCWVGLMWIVTSVLIGAIGVLSKENIPSKDSLWRGVG